MESTNTPNDHFEDQILGSSSSSSTLAIPCSYGGGTTTHHANWNPNSIMNTNGFSSYHTTEPFSNIPREFKHQENTMIASQYNSIASDLGFQYWANTTGNFTNNNQSLQDFENARIKEEGSNNIHTKFQFRNLSSENLMNKIELFPRNLYPFNNGDASNGRVQFSQILPSVHVPNSNLDMNLQALDLLTSSRFNTESFNPSSHDDDQIEVLRDGFSYDLIDHMHQSHDQMGMYSSSNKIEASCNGLVEAKRTSGKMEPKAIQTAPKKSRLESRASCPPFKVRKEKLGDRIASLQQLVAPFGKTDTASVLMEAIGYIKFLQNQVETLSVPYMKTSRNKTRGMKGGSHNIECEDSKRDLKSRGLCLVPLSCLSYITDGGGAVWPPPPHFGGAV